MFGSRGTVEPVTECLQAAVITALTGLLQSSLHSDKQYYGKHVSGLRNIIYVSLSLERFFLKKMFLSAKQLVI